MVEANIAGRVNSFLFEPRLTRARRRTAVLRRLLVGVREPEHCAIRIGTPHKGDAGRQPVAREPRRDGDRRYEYQISIQVRRAWVVHVRRIDTVADQRWLVLDGFMDNGVEFVVCHGFQNVRHQLIARDQIVVVFARIRGLLSRFFAPTRRWQTRATA